MHSGINSLVLLQTRSKKKIKLCSKCFDFFLEKAAIYSNQFTKELWDQVRTNRV